MVKEIKAEDLQQALELVNNVFAEFVAIRLFRAGKKHL